MIAALGCAHSGAGAARSVETGQTALGTDLTAPKQSVDPKPLDLVRALPIDRWDNFQPSGLLWHAGRLLTVSDKHDGQIFELLIGRDIVTVRPYITLRLPPDAEEFDFEGLASDGQGGLLVACEEPLRVLRIDAQQRTSWLTPPLTDLGRKVGLFQLHNASIEGIARLPDGGLMIAAERSDRGLIELPAPFDLVHARAWNMHASRFVLSGSRTPDFSDLTTYHGDLYALLRNGHLVVQMERVANGWREGQAWSFAEVENDARYAYADRQYGVSEGLAIDDSFVYIALDNNGDSRLSEARDVRPQLLVFRRP